MHKLIYETIKITNYEGIKQRSEKTDLLASMFERMKSCGFDPKHIIDIGANRGTWTRSVLDSFPNAQYTLFEPQENLQQDFQDLLDSNSRIKFFPIGLGNSTGEFQFTIVDRDDSCNFRFTPEEAAEQGFEQISVPMDTLNNVIDKENLPVPDIIKIDAEGLDLEVLAGASDFFGQTEVFLVEVGVANKTMPNSVQDVVNFMENNGYTLFDITDLNRPFGNQVLWLMELAFVKKGGVIDIVNWKK